jgi:acid phosphatase class B
MDVVFDLDGTICDCGHRRHFVASKPKNFGAFNRAMVHDTPHEDIIQLMHMHYDADHRILIATGRGEEDREKTEQWLADHDANYHQRMYMRPAKDYRSDDIIKEEILAQMRIDGYDPKLVYDDRDQVVAMWRRNGIRCLQVDYGDF